jgi:hypothetical protein
LILLAASACEADAPPDATPSGSGYDPPGSLTLTKVLSIDAEFGSISKVAADTSGRIFVADQMSLEVVVFSRDGRKIGTVGRPGQGPGEFRFLTDIVVLGEELVAFDGGSQRVSVFDVSGEQLGSFRSSMSSLTGTGETARHSILVDTSGDVFLQMSRPLITPGGIGSNVSVLRQLSADGKVVRDSLLVVENSEVLITPGRSGGASAEPMPFGGERIVRMDAAGRIYHAWSGSRSVTVFRPGSRERRDIQLPFHQRESLSDRHTGPYRESIVAKGGVLGRLELIRFDEAIAKGRLPDSLPTMRNFLVDGAGRIWVQRIVPETRLVSTAFGPTYESPDGTEDLLVVDPSDERAWLGSLPGDTRMSALVEQRLYLIRKDQFGVESVEVYQVDLGG